MILIIFPKLFTKSFQGLSIFPFVFLKDKSLKKDVVLLNHERIHLRQQIELLWILFFIWYSIEFFIHWIIFRDSGKAYRNISFEREAYKNEKDLNYLKTRKMFRFLQYL